MLPAIFAVLLLGHFVAAEIYVGQNPQNVNAVIKDASGNLVPVTGVADEIVVVDLNYGGEESSSGMSVDVSVSPVNGSSSGGSGYPSGYPLGYPSEYPSSSSPSGPEEVSSPSMSSVPVSSFPNSAAPVSLPSSSSPSAVAPPSNPPNPFSSMFGGSGSSGASGSAPSLFNPFGSSSPSNSALGTGSSPAAPSLTPPTSTSPVSEYDNMVSNMNSGSPNTNAGASSPPPTRKSLFPGLSGLFGSKQPTKKKPQKPNSFGSFIELGGALGPINDTLDNTSTSILNNIPTVASVPLTPTFSGTLGNLTPFNMFGSLPKFNGTFPPTSSWNSSIPAFNMSSLPMFNTSSFSIPSSLPNFLNSLLGSSSMNLQPSSSPSPFSSIINSFSNGSSSPFNSINSNALPFGNLLGPFLNSGSLLFPTATSGVSPLTNLMNSFMNTSSTFNSSGIMDSLDDMMDSFMNGNPMMSSSTNGSLNPFTDIMDMIINTTSSMFNSTSSTSPFTNIMNSFLNGSSSIFGPMGTSGSPFSSLFPNSASLPIFGNDTGLKGIMQNMLPFDFGDDSDYYDYPEDIDSDFMPESSGEDNDSSSSELVQDMGNMVNTLLTPGKNGTTPFTNMMDNVFGGNGTLTPPTNLFGPGGILNLTTFSNTSSFSFGNFTPMSNWLRIISSLNNTGLFGDLSDIYTLAQNLSSVVSQSMHNKTNIANTIGLAMSDIQGMMTNITPAFQTFLKNIASKHTSNSTAQSSPPSSQSFLPFQPPLMGSSFLAIPSSPPAPAIPAVPAIPTLTQPFSSTADMINDAPQPQSEATTSETTPTQNATTSEQSSSSTSTSPQPSSTEQSNSSEGTPNPSSPTKAPSANPSPASSGINLSSTCITLVGCLIVAFSQKHFLGLI